MLLSLFKDLLVRTDSRNQEELDRARILIQNSQLNSASRILDALLERSPNYAAALLLRGKVKRLLESPREAMPDLERALELQPGSGECHFEMALCWAKLGDLQLALESCQKARKITPGSVTAFMLLAELRLPGDFYFDVLAHICAHLRPKTYVEIGVFQGASLRLAKSASTVIGIDPDPRIDWPLEPHMKVFKTTSDDFFATRDLVAELGGRRVDLAFIDGMHQFEYAMRDFANLERHCERDSVILVHDCYPMDEESAGRERLAVAWSGDVWRLIVLLKKYRPDLLIHTIGTAPTGLAVIQNLDPQSTFLLDNHDRLYQEFLSLDYSYLADDQQTKLNLFPNDWAAIEKMIKPRVH